MTCFALKTTVCAVMPKAKHTHSHLEVSDSLSRLRLVRFHDSNNMFTLVARV